MSPKTSVKRHKRKLENGKTTTVRKHRRQLLRKPKILNVLSRKKKEPKRIKECITCGTPILTGDKVKECPSCEIGVTQRVWREEQIRQEEREK